MNSLSSLALAAALVGGFAPFTGADGPDDLGEPTAGQLAQSVTVWAPGGSITYWDPKSSVRAPSPNSSPRSAPT